MPAIVSITAKIMGLVDTLLNAWVTAEFTSNPLSGSACEVATVNYTVTACGADIILYLQQLVYFGLQLGGYMLPALGAVPDPLP